MTVIALDTNVLLRTLIDDPDQPGQCEQARGLVAEIASARISSVVFAETMWVLDASYAVPRKQLAVVARSVLAHPRYQVQDERNIAAAIDLFERSNVEFGDALALIDARAHERVLHTFDRKLGRLPGAQLLGKT